eukprot:Nitzschia sp. Nitz4//scaffold406_size10313//7600//8724//NITZ4_009077-RA/size10313-processed-gene-0.6-mRNA-1//-1//CDS//3329551131//7471//frame0
MAGLFRSWGVSPKEKDPEIQRLEREAEETRQKIAELREKGRIRRAHRLQALDALETRRLTLTEIYKRMENELSTKDVYDYADVLAEVFGERKIYAHRAIGLEALLCQFMHQMLAKQHQLKILKKAGKDLQKQYQHHKTLNRDEFHSYDALAVQLEAMRLSLEAQYDDVFAVQHALLARMHHVEAGGTMTNYKINKPAKEKVKATPKLAISTKHAKTPIKSRDANRSKEYNGDSEDDDAALHDILLTDAADNSTASKQDSAAGESLESGKSTKSARERRREIEQQRLAKGHAHTAELHWEDPNSRDSPRERMRELEAKLHSQEEDDAGELKERRTARSSVGYHSKDIGETDAEARRKRMERRKAKAAALVAGATS